MTFSEKYTLENIRQQIKNVVSSDENFDLSVVYFDGKVISDYILNNVDKEFFKNMFPDATEKEIENHIIVQAQRNLPSSAGVLEKHLPIYYGILSKSYMERARQLTSFLMSSGVQFEVPEGMTAESEEASMYVLTEVTRLLDSAKTVKVFSVKPVDHFVKYADAEGIICEGIDEESGSTLQFIWLLYSDSSLANFTSMGTIKE